MNPILTVRIDGVTLTETQVEEAMATLTAARQLRNRELHRSGCYICIPKAVVQEMATALKANGKHYGCVTAGGAVCYDSTKADGAQPVVLA